MNGDVKEFIKKILPVVILIPIALGLLLNIPTGRFTIGDESSWVGFFGNYSGGIIGGLVAWYIAKTQINEQNTKQIKNEEEIRFINQLPALIKIKLDLKRMLGSVNFVIENVKENVADKNIDHLEIVKEMSFNCHVPKEENWSTINLIDDVDFHVNLVEIKDLYDEFQEIMNYQLLKTQQQISILIESNLNNSEFIYAINEKGEELNRMKELKSQIYKDVIEKDLVNSIEESLKLLNLILDSIEVIKNNRSRIRDSI